MRLIARKYGSHALVGGGGQNLLGRNTAKPLVPAPPIPHLIQCLRGRKVHVRLGSRDSCHSQLAATQTHCVRRNR